MILLLAVMVPPVQIQPLLLTSINPTSDTLNAPGFTITANGNNFPASSVVVEWKFSCDHFYFCKSTHSSSSCF